MQNVYNDSCYKAGLSGRPRAYLVRERVGSEFLQRQLESTVLKADLKLDRDQDIRRHRSLCSHRFEVVTRSVAIDDDARRFTTLTVCSENK